MFALNRGAASSVRWRGAVPIVLVICLVGALAWAGHGAATPDAIGDVQLTGDVLHLVAAGIWIGGLLPLTAVLVIARRAGDVRSIAIAAEATRRFSTLGVVSVLTLLVSGVVNTYVLAGSVPALVGTPYGRLLLIKISLFIAMILIAVFNRQGLTPRLASAAAGEPSMALGALAHLVRNSLTELALGLAILVIVGALGVLRPGLHDQPVWPFPVRFSTDALDDPQLRNSIFAAFAAVVISGLLVVGAVLWRRLRWPAIICAALLAGYFAPTLRNFTEPAYPTSYAEGLAANVITKVAYRAARAGMITGVLLAIARISGETAPLLFTALNNQFWSTDLNAPVASLPVVIFQFALSPYKDWQKLAWTGALIITLAVLALSIIARLLAAQRKSS
jgi:uncharacterized membrane protein